MITPPSSATRRPPPRATTPKPRFASPGSMPRTTTVRDSARRFGCLRAAAARRRATQATASRPYRSPRAMGHSSSPPRRAPRSADTRRVLGGSGANVRRCAGSLPMPQARVRALEAQLADRAAARSAHPPARTRRLPEHPPSARCAPPRPPGAPSSAIVIDIDGFRELNARRGSTAGDLALAALADHLRRLTRGSDVLGRSGADEITILMAGTDLAGRTTAATA